MGIVAKSGFYGGKFLKAGRFHGNPDRESETDLGAMTKDELLAEAERRGVEVKASDTKAEIIAAIEAAKQ